MPKVTIDDISRETGLSRGTVSRALNDRSDISAATKQRVNAACVKLHYTPSFAARSLATGRNLAIAAIVGPSLDPWTSDTLRGVAQQADAARYALQIVALPAGAARADRIRALAAERVDGLLLMTELSSEHMRLLGQTNERPLVACQPLDGATCDAISPDFMEAGRLAARTLLGTGARTLLHLRRTHAAAVELHRAGFTEACRGANVDTDRLRLADVHERTAPESLARHLTGVDAIACTDNPLAFSALVVCALAGRRAGRDVSVLGFGPPPGNVVCFALATIDPGGCEIGRRAAALVVQRIQRERLDAAQTIRIAPTLITGGTLVS